MIRNYQEILKIIEENRETIRGFGVRSLGLFGSAVRGEATDTSDLDFVVEFEKKTFDGYMGLKKFLEESFGCKVDLVLKDAIKPRLREPILKETIYAQGL
jgi:predicted nucleotidyltransferase